MSAWITFNLIILAGPWFVQLWKGWEGYCAGNCFEWCQVCSCCFWKKCKRKKRSMSTRLMVWSSIARNSRSGSVIWVNGQIAGRHVKMLKMLRLWFYMHVTSDRLLSLVASMHEIPSHNISWHLLIACNMTMAWLALCSQEKIWCQQQVGVRVNPWQLT